MSENAKSNSGGLTPVLIIVIVIAVIFCCLCFLCAVAAVWLIDSSDFFFEDWEYWSSVLRLFG